MYPKATFEFGDGLMECCLGVRLRYVSYDSDVLCMEFGHVSGNVSWHVSGDVSSWSNVPLCLHS